MRGILVEALGPVSLTEHGVDHPSLVHVCDSHVQHLTIVIMIAFCAVICPDLSLTSGQVLYSDTTPPRYEGSTATYACGNGYQISGTATRMCTASGWSGTPPSCTGLLIDWFPLPFLTAICPDLTLSNGLINYTPTSTPRLEGATATHSCDTGYTLSSSTPTRTCQSDRTWSGSSLTCPSELYWPFKVFYKLIFSCGLWQSSDDLKWSAPSFCNYIWRDGHLHMHWELSSIRKLHSNLYG